MAAALLFLLLAWPTLTLRAGELPTDWERIETRHMTVHVSGASLRAGQAIAADADQVMEELLTLTGLEAPEGHVNAYLARTRKSFEAIQPGTPPTWAAGTAYPDKGLIFVLLATRGEKTPRHVFAHELAHVVLHWTFGETEPPRWLDEGLAQVAAGEFSLQTHTILTRAAVGGGLIPLSSLTRRFPSDPVRARIAYAESRDFVLYVRHRFGDEAVAELIRGIASGLPIEEALLGATGQSMDALEAAWAGRLSRRYGWLPVLGGSGSVWSVAALLLVAGWARKRRAKKRKLEEMGEAEREVDERRQAAWPPGSAGPPMWRDDDGPDRQGGGTPTVH